jgi:hypothetical protein
MVPHIFDFFFVAMGPHPTRAPLPTAHGSAYFSFANKTRKPKPQHMGPQIFDYFLISLFLHIDDSLYIRSVGHVMLQRNNQHAALIKDVVRFQGCAAALVNGQVSFFKHTISTAKVRPIFQTMLHFRSDW